MPPAAAFLILLGCAAGAAVASGLRLAGFAAGHALLPGDENLRSALFAIGVVAGAGGGALAGGAVALTLRRLLRRPRAALAIVVLVWAVSIGADAAMRSLTVYEVPLVLGILTAVVGLAMLPMAPRPSPDSL